MSTVKFDTHQSSDGTRTFPPCTAWVYFSGGGTIQDSENVSSITDNGAGDFAVNFSTAMADTNYAWANSVENTLASTSVNALQIDGNTTQTKSTTSLGVTVKSVTASTEQEVDPQFASVIVFGGLG